MGTCLALGIDKKFACASLPRRRYFLDILCWNSSLGNGLDQREMPRLGGVMDDADPGCRWNLVTPLAQHNEVDKLSWSNALKTTHRGFGLLCCAFRHRQCSVSEGDTNGAVSSQRRSFLLEPNSQRIQPTASLPADTRQQTTGFQGIRISIRLRAPSNISHYLLPLLHRFDYHQ
jgi:hypothetical protein